MKFGIIGCGAISRCYVEALGHIEGSSLVYAHDADLEKLSQFCLENNLTTCDTFEKLLESDADALCICTPSGLHTSYAVCAARAGKHVVCEKPIGIAKEQLDLIGRACKEIKFAAISQLYFSGAFQKALAAVKSGRLGRLILGDLSMKYHRNGQYYQGWHGTASMDGGGALMNQGIHGISALLHLMGPVKSVTALTRTLIHSIEVEDTAVAVVEFENNALGNIIGTTSIQPASPRILSIHGTKGTIALTEDAISQWDIQGETEIVDSEAGTVSAASDPTNFTAILHQRQLEDFIDAIECDRPPKLGYKEGRAPVDLILAMYESSRTGKTVYIT